MQTGKTIEYNSTRTAVKLPEYGRYVQDMVDYALTIENRAERQHYAEAIFCVMLGLTPKMRGVDDYEHKVWNHLAMLSGYQLDIDYPFPIENKDKKREPCHLSYPGNHIRFRHYGRLVELALEKIDTLPEGRERDMYVRLVANRMKRNLAEWKADNAEDEKVAKDIMLYTEGRVRPDFSACALPTVRLPQPMATMKGKKGKNKY